MIRAQLTGVENLRVRLNGKLGMALSGIEKVVVSETLNLLAYVKAEKLSDQVLHVRTGRLRRSITPRNEKEGSTFRGIVGTNVVYARAWELGFDRKVGYGANGGNGARGGKPISQAQKAWLMNRHPPSVKHFNARPFLKPSLEENTNRITTNLRAALAEAMQS